MLTELKDAPADAASPRTAIERAIAQIWSEVLSVTNVRAEDDFFSLGGDSLLSIQVVSKAKRRGIHLDYRMIFRSPTVRQLAASVEAGSVEAGHAAGSSVEASRIEAADAPSPSVAASDAVPLTPIQKRFFETAGSHVNHWNQWVLLDLKAPLKLRDLYLSLKELHRVHDVLRLAFRREGSDWTQRYRAPDVKGSVTWVDLSAHSPAEQRAALDVQHEKANQGLCPEDGKLIRVVYLDLGPSSPHKLLIVAHHLIVDNVSFHLLVDDLDTCLTQCANGLAPRLEDHTCTYQAWAETLNRSAAEGRFESEIDYWRGQIQPPAQPIPSDMPADDGENVHGEKRSCEISFSAQQTLAIVNKLPTLLHCHVNSILLDALARALHDCFGVAETVVDVESHGRQWIDDSVDLRKTTGWYTSIFPHRLSAAHGGSVYERVRAVDRQFRAVPNGGVGYGVLRYLSKSGDASSVLSAPAADVCFNYLGQVGRAAQGLSAFSTANMRVGASHAKDLRRLHRLLVQSTVIDSKLVVQCQYSARFHREDTISRLLASMQQHLNGLLPAVAVGFRRSFRQLADEGAGASNTLEMLQQIAVFYPLLGIQTSVLFQHLRSQSGVPPYLVQASCTLRGNLIVSAFEQAWQTIVARHESLRTSFHWDGLEAPVQAVHRSGRVATTILDWRGKDAEVQQTDLQRLLRKDRLAGIALDGAEPLMRVTVVRLADDRFFCNWTHHHIQLDGWSQAVVLRELFQIYRAIVSGEPVVLPAAPLLGDYLRSLDRFPSAEAARYWRRYLQGFREPTPILSSAVGLSDPESGGSERYRALAIEVGAADSDEVRQFAKTHSLTLHTIFSAVWGLWLSVLSGQNDVVFGNVVSGRSADMESVQDLVGAVINTIPVRMVLDEGADLLQWLKRVQEEQAASQRYELHPLADIVKLAETAKGRLLFDSILVFENHPGGYEPIVAAAGLEIESLDFTIQENYPVVVTIRPDEAITAQINYREDVVDSRIRQAQSLFTAALTALTRDSGQSLLQFKQSVAELV